MDLPPPAGCGGYNRVIGQMKCPPVRRMEPVMQATFTVLLALIPSYECYLSVQFSAHEVQNNFNVVMIEF